MSIELNIVIMMMMTMMVIINDDFIIAVIDNNAFLPSWSFSPSHESLYGTCYYTPVNQAEANKEQAENKAKRAASGDQSAMTGGKEFKHRHCGVFWLEVEQGG